MDAKKEIIKKIVLSRRSLAKLKMMEGTNFCVESLLNLQARYLQLLQKLQLTMKISYSSEKLSWLRQPPLSFWEIECQQINDSLFKDYFHMKRATFYKLCELLKINTDTSEVIPLTKRVAIGLYALCSCKNYQTIANMFNVAESSVCEILLSFCDEVWRVLAPRYLKNFPLSKTKVETLKQEFETLGFPQCIGALDSCHIEVQPCQENAIDYYNYERWYSTVLLALVDTRCRFLYVSCGSPGRFNDSEIFERSSLKRQLDECRLLNDLKKNISGMDVPLFIIGDSAYKLSNKLMKPYSISATQSPKQMYFNDALLKSHRVVGDAFKQLKARFMRIGKVAGLRNASAIILSSCALHNFLNDNNDTINEKWLQDLAAMEVNRIFPEHFTELVDQSSGQNPERIRKAISNYLAVDDDGTSGIIGGEDDDDESMTGDESGERVRGADTGEGMGCGDRGEVLLPSEFCCVIIDEVKSEKF